MKAVVLLNILVKAVMHFFQSSKEEHLFEIWILNVFTVSFNLCNDSLLNKSVNFLKKNLTVPQIFKYNSIILY